MTTRNRVIWLGFLLLEKHFGECMKLKVLLGAVALSHVLAFSAQACSITYNATNAVTEEIKKRSFVFENYDRVCAQLKKANAGVRISNVSMISPYQTTAAVSIQLYNLEGNQSLRTYSNHWIRYEQERTTTAEKQAIYDVTMSAFNEIDADMISALNKERKLNGLKTY